jgi:hypothetical protein
MSSITSANAVIMLSVAGVFNAPVPMQQFSADDIFGNDPIQANEVSMGIDGVLAAGFVFNPVPWSLSLMANSPSNDFFDQWYQAMRKEIDTFRAEGTIWLKSINKKYAMTNGALTTYGNMPNAQKTLRPRQHIITWESISPALVG